MNIEKCAENYLKKLRRQQQAIAKENQQRQIVVEKIKRCLTSSDTSGVFYLFGSTAEGKATPGSDIDIAVDGIAPEAYFKIWNLLTEAIDGYFIDLRDITGKENFFARRVRKYGIKL